VLLVGQHLGSNPQHVSRPVADTSATGEVRVWQRWVVAPSRAQTAQLKAS
jgi:hypothetical protein